MNEQIAQYLEKYPAEVTALFLTLRQLIYDVAPVALTETMWAKLPGFSSGDSFVRLIPFRDHINIEAKTLIFHREELAGYPFTPKGMLQLYPKREVPVSVLTQVFSELFQ